MIQITLPDNSVRQYSEGITPLEIAKDIHPALAKKALAAKVNGEVRDLHRPIITDASLSILTWDDTDGKAAFWHTSAHLMAAAVEQLFPGAKFGIGPDIENGFYYDIDFGSHKLTEEELPLIEKKMKQIAGEQSAMIRKDISKADAISFFTEKGDEYKQELISELEDGQISLYELGQFTDLCRGPHLPDTSGVKAIKILSIAGAYWRGDITRKQLTRIYGITFPQQKLLDEYLILLEEAKKRDHRKLGKDLELFTFSQQVGSGLPLWLPKGTIVRELLEEFLKKVQKQYGYQAVITPHIANKNLYITSGHYEKYGKDSFQPIGSPVEGEEFLLKPMNCPHHCEIYAHKPMSYKDLPLRLAEFGTVYRYEQSGELHGLTRVRGFTQDDAHIFCTPDQLKEEFIKVIEIVLLIFRKLEFSDFTAQISLRDPADKQKYIGTDENWKKAEDAIIEACEMKGLKAEQVIGEAAFYGPKLDFMVRDAIGRKWQLGTIQVDYNLPERFDLHYIGSDNQKHRPVMIHRAPFGSMERFVAVLLEHTGGKLPLWLSPEQIIILPISEKFHNFANRISEQFSQTGIRINIDTRSEKIGKKIRDAEMMKTPYMIIIGEKEVNEERMSVRKHGSGDIGSFGIEEFLQRIQEELQTESEIQI
jgi:threonyl-tRNA synthetase